MAKTLAFLLDGYGEPSLTRLVHAVWTLGVMVVWACVSMVKRELQAIDPGVVGVIATLTAGKVGQSFSANDGPQRGAGASTAAPAARSGARTAVRPYGAPAPAVRVPNGPADDTGA